MIRFIRTIGGIGHALFTCLLFIFAGLIVVSDAIRAAVRGEGS